MAAMLGRAASTLSPLCASLASCGCDAGRTVTDHTSCEWTAETWDAHRPPTLRQWLSEKPFALAWSQGFGCEVASLGATLALADGLGSEAALRKQVLATSGASSGAKVAAVVATPGASLEAMAASLKGLRFRDVLCDFGDTALSRGGWVHATKMRAHLAHFVGEGARLEDLTKPFNTTAFDLKSLRVVAIGARTPRDKGDVVDACFGSGAFPPLFPPVAFGDCLLTDLAFFTDAAGLRGMAGRPGRVLQIANADFPMNGPWVVKAPSDLDHLGRPEVVSVVLTGMTRVMPIPPGAGARVPAALDGARSGVRAALDAPLAKGSEPGHYVARVRARATPRDAEIRRANAAAALGLVVLALAAARRS